MNNSELRPPAILCYSIKIFNQNSSTMTFFKILKMSPLRINILWPLRACLALWQLLPPVQSMFSTTILYAVAVGQWYGCGLLARQITYNYDDMGFAHFLRCLEKSLSTSAACPYNSNLLLSLWIWTYGFYWPGIYWSSYSCHYKFPFKTQTQLLCMERKTTRVKQVAKRLNKAWQPFDLHPKRKFFCTRLCIRRL